MLIKLAGERKKTLYAPDKWHTFNIYALKIRKWKHPFNSKQTVFCSKKKKKIIEEMQIRYDLKSHSTRRMAFCTNTNQIAKLKLVRF